MRPLFFFVIFFTWSATIQAQIIPSTRLATWQGNVGVPGGIPNRTTIYKTFSPGATATEINQAIATCPDNQVVQLAAGTFTLDKALEIKRNSITLRGAAAPAKTIITGITGVTGRLINMESPEIRYEWDPPVAANHVNVESGYTQNSKNLVVSATSVAGSPATIPAGRLIYMDQLNDADADAHSAGNGPKAGPGIYTSLTDPNWGSDRWQQQVFKVVTVNGTNITVDPPVAMGNWTASLTPQIWWQSSDPLSGSGVEDLTVQSKYDGSFNGIVQLYNTYGCWLKNVHVIGGRRGIYLEYTARSEVRHSQVELPDAYDPYPLAVYHSSGALIEDNIVNNTNGGTAILLTGANASVFAYNYTTKFDYGTWSYGSLNFHGNHPSMNLFEGNVGANMLSLDSQWGSSSYNTAFRNYFTGHDESNTSIYINNEQAICIAAKNRYINVVGNVLGTPGRNTMYQDTAPCGPGYETKRVFLIGNQYNYCENGAYDPEALSTLLRVLNWDSAHGNIADAGKYTASDLPKSLFYSQKPSWWPGNLVWPPVDPFDRAHSINPENLPAGYRFVHGVDAGSGSEPAPPSNLKLN